MPDVSVEWDEVAALRAANVRLRQVIEARDAEIAVLRDHEGKEPVYRQLTAILRGAIHRGDYPAGRKIPSEATLIQEHDLACETVREAARVLAAEGLVEVVQGRGVYVTEQS